MRERMVACALCVFLIAGCKPHAFVAKTVGASVLTVQFDSNGCPKDVPRDASCSRLPNPPSDMVCREKGEQIWWKADAKVPFSIEMQQTGVLKKDDSLWPANKCQKSS